MSVEQIIDNEQERVKYISMLDTLEDKYTTLMEKAADLERAVKTYCLTWAGEHPDSKASMERVEQNGIKTPENKADYLELVSIRIRIKMVETIIGMAHDRLSAVQTGIRASNPRV